MALVSVVIVTWNNENDIEGCLQSVIGNEEKCEIICIDNDSSDRTLEILQRITNLHKGKFEDENTPPTPPLIRGTLNSPLALQVYKNETNVGFTKAVNQGIRHASGEYIFLLNPDTILEKGSVRILSGFLDKNKDYNACCPKLLNEDGSVQCSIRNFPNYLTMLFEFTLLSAILPKSRTFGNWKMEYFDYTTDADVEQPMAAALMVRKTAAEMDERFEMFFNDVDLCKKIIDTGGKIRYISEAHAIHKKGASVGRDKARMIKTWCRDCLSYFEKHHRNRFLLMWLRISLKVSEILRILWYKFTG